MGRFVRVAIREEPSSSRKGGSTWLVTGWRYYFLSSVALNNVRHAGETILLTCPDGAERLREWARTWFEANIPKGFDLGVKKRMDYW